LSLCSTAQPLYTRFTIIFSSCFSKVTIGFIPRLSGRALADLEVDLDQVLASGALPGPVGLVPCAYGSSRQGRSGHFYLPSRLLYFIATLLVQNPQLTPKLSWDPLARNIPILHSDKIAGASVPGALSWPGHQAARRSSAGSGRSGWWTTGSATRGTSPETARHGPPRPLVILTEIDSNDSKITV
jgi:hypothetical protein